VIYAIGFASSARDGVGLAGWLSGTRFVGTHQPFGDWGHREMNRYDVLRTVTELSAFRDLDEAEEAEWLQFKDQVRRRVS
jgi:hypothetical protein